MNYLVIYPAFIDFEEVLIIIVVAVILFGPDKIPEIARGLGSAVRKLKEASEDIKQEIMNPIENVNPIKDIQNSLNDINPMDDFKKSFDEVKNPIMDMDNIIHENKKIIIDQKVEEKNSFNKSKIIVVNNNVDIEKSEIEKNPIDDELGLGGSVSR